MASTAPLAVDWNEVKTLALAIGVREAARQLEISEEAVMKRCSREGWLREQREIVEVQQTAIAEKRVRQGLSATVRTAADVMKTWDGETRFDLAKGLRAGAATVADMDGQEVLMAAQQVNTLVKSAALVHGWSVNITGSVRLDVLASGAGDQEPVIDV